MAHDRDWVLTEGEVSLRPFVAEDEAALVAGRDDEWARWLGPGDEHPKPTACIVVGGRVVGWVDSDPDLARLQPGETNLGYSVFAMHRGAGCATRAVLLMLRRLAQEGILTTASLEVHPLNIASLRVAEKAGFARAAETDDWCVFIRPID